LKKRSSTLLTTVDAKPILRLLFRRTDSMKRERHPFNPADRGDLAGLTTDRAFAQALVVGAAL
jgi:hypothetical protein